METPITDAATSHCICNAHDETDTVPRSVAVELETKLIEARREAEGWRDEQRRTYTAAGGTWNPEIHKLPWENESSGATEPKR